MIDIPLSSVVIDDCLLLLGSRVWLGKYGLLAV